ncbi:MAG: tyrosine-protein phosphatase [Coriobacteriaceae bacterium]|nr:tyrosine-protein phosphatase [Coriobacteriaceae bacterium]
MNLSDTLGYVDGFPALMNVRELGGIAAADSRTVRHGVFYRGAALAGLTQEQRLRVDSMGLSLVLDLRASFEVRSAPDYVPKGCAYEQVSGMLLGDGGELEFSQTAIAKQAVKIGRGFPAFRRNLYVSMVHGNPAMHALVENVVARRTPMFIHCSAGKDRTGVASAIILSILGASDEAILDDFMRTNVYLAQLIENVPDEIPAAFMRLIPEGMDMDAATQLMRAIWPQANGVVLEDMQAVLAAMDEGHASREEYLADEFGLDAKRLAELRDYYLE